MEENTVNSEKNMDLAQSPTTDRKKLTINFKDVGVAMFIGLLLGILFLPILRVSQSISIAEVLYNNSLLFVIGFIIASGIGMVAAYLISYFVSVVLQIARFVLVGGLNTILDLSVLSFVTFLLYQNFLIEATSGWPYAGAKSISFMIAAVNSFFWNKYWTFKKTDRSEEGKEFAKFLIIALIGFGLNVGLSTFIATKIGPQWGVGKELWGLLSAFIAVFASMVWNFLGLKLLVFKK